MTPPGRGDPAARIVFKATICRKKSSCNFAQLAKISHTDIIITKFHNCVRSRANYSGGYKFMNNDISTHIQHISIYPFISNIFKVFNANLSLLLDCPPYSSQIRKKTLAMIMIPCPLFISTVFFQLRILNYQVHFAHRDLFLLLIV